MPIRCRFAATTLFGACSFRHARRRRFSPISLLLADVAVFDFFAAAAAAYAAIYAAALRATMLIRLFLGAIRPPLSPPL